MNNLNKDWYRLALLSEEDETVNPGGGKGNKQLKVKEKWLYEPAKKNPKADTLIFQPEYDPFVDTQSENYPGQKHAQIKPDQVETEKEFGLEKEKSINYLDEQYNFVLPYVYKAVWHEKENQMKSYIINLYQNPKTKKYLAIMHNKQKILLGNDIKQAISFLRGLNSKESFEYDQHIKDYGINVTH